MIVAAEISSQYVFVTVEKDEMTTGKVFASRVVRNSANSSSFHAKIKTKVATVAIPLFAKGSATIRKVWNHPHRERQVEPCVGDYQCRHRVEHPCPVEHHVERHSSRNRRHHAGRQDPVSKEVLRAKLEVDEAKGTR